ncbi:MAG: hypothetical protein KGZ25_12580, partial [Planctomycetes bacterium]|nr:hypothetical protein [Planctomycetota bacterium]
MKDCFSIILLLFVALLSWPVSPGWAGGLGLGEPGGAEDDLLAEIEAEDREGDLDGLKHSHLSEIENWEGVGGKRRRKSEKVFWKAVGVGDYSGRTFARPVSDKPVRARIKIPESGEYRLWLGYIVRRDKSQSLNLRLTGANTSTHIFGKYPLTRSSGKEQEEKFPLRFDSDRDRMSASVNKAAMAWEFHDVDLQAGDTVFELRSGEDSARVDALFLSQSHEFIPSKAPLHGTLNRTYYRFRVVETESDTKGTGVGERLTYHWRHYPPGYDRPLWYASLRTFEPDHVAGPLTSATGSRKVRVGEWTRWIDATGTVTAPGPYATSRISFENVPTGVAEVQLAWFTHPAAEMRTIRPGIASHVATCMIPLDRQGYSAPFSSPNAESGAWGMRPQSYLERLETAADVHERHYKWAREAIEALGPGADRPTPRHIRLYTSFHPAPAAREKAAKMLSTLGLNWFAAPLEIREKYGIHPDHVLHYNDALFYARTHCPTDPMIGSTYMGNFQRRATRIEKNHEGGREQVLTLKMGDEIGAITSSTHINRCADCRALFHRHLKNVLKDTGKDASFFGVEKVEQLPYRPSFPENAGRYQRRLYYHSHLFKFRITAEFYRTLTGVAEEVFPNIKTYCNFSPHPPMFGGHMNHSDWFALTRLGGATMAWGEDWATGGSWGMAGIQTVSYYGAWVECAAMHGKLPSGFYNVSSCGRCGRKMFSLLAHGIKLQHIYSWGPRYAGAEGSNFWSENPGVYKQLARATHALGPADEIIAQGKRVPRRVALLYNRTHEIWNGSYGGFQTDRLLTFLALQHAHIPVHVIIEEDLTEDKLDQYQVLYMQGFNLSREDIDSVRRWVEKGGILVGIAGTAMHSRYNEPIEAGARLFGARQRLDGCSSGGWHAMKIPKHESIDTVSFSKSELTPELSFP